jgi:methylmalonyl-CoA mutase cobalamin-binding subunit
VLREAGIAMIFTPGTPLDEISRWVGEHLKEGKE